VTDLVKTVFAGFSRFVLAWLLPSLSTLGVFVIFVYPDISSTRLFGSTSQSTSGIVSKSAAFILGAITLGTLLSLASRPLYRVLEGYLLPTQIKKSLLRRQIRKWLRLRAAYERTPHDWTTQRGLLRERLGDYPDRRERLLPTRLGNAFKALETFGVDRFNLDSQTFWYELNALAPERVRKDADDARAAVDFFISFVAHLALLSIISLIVAANTGSAGALAVCLTSVVLVKVAYDAAVRNMTDWRYAVQALVNLGRMPLASNLGYRLPATLRDERELWRAWGRFVRHGRETHQTYLSKFDDFRVGSEESSEALPSDGQPP
jgi:hypothetical protein